MRPLRRLFAFLRYDDGASFAEYGLLLGLVAVALIAVMNTAGPAISRYVHRATCALTEYGATGGSAAGGGGHGGWHNTGTNPNGTTNNGGANNTGASGDGC